MTSIMIRIVVRDFAAWRRTHLANAESRRTYGLIDGSIYRDIDDSNVVLIHMQTMNVARAWQWFATEISMDVGVTIVRREAYLVERLDLPRSSAREEI